MKKKYQVFISSTYTDLKQERMAVTQCLLDNDCIPVGMEQFPASGMSQMDYIKKMLDDCDYYILILAGRYGVSVGRFSPFRVGLKTPISVNLKSPMHHVCY